MKVLCFELMEASGGRASASTLADLAASANELVIELTRRVHQVSKAWCDCVWHTMVLLDGVYHSNTQASNPDSIICIEENGMCQRRLQIVLLSACLRQMATAYCLLI